MTASWKKITAGVALLVLAACANKSSPTLVLEQSSYSRISGWEDDRLGEALVAFDKSCGALLKKNSESYHGAGPWKIKAEAWKEVCAKSAMLSPEERLNPRAFFEANFVPYRIDTDGDSDGLFTGYYVPLLKGSKQCGGRYNVPLYRKPADLQQGESYYSREQIMNGKLNGRGLELVCVDDAVDAFFMEIQGSGIIALPDGSRMVVGYAGQNGHEYTPIGRILRERGELAPDNVSMKSIKAWLRSNPSQADALMNQNHSYVFFRVLDTQGVKGAQGVELTDERSLAVDKRYFPMGLPIFLSTRLPDDAETNDAGQAYRRLLMAQDTGGAIKGPRRGDVFFGAGDRAATLAGHMQQTGETWALVPRALAASIGTRTSWKGK